MCYPGGWWTDGTSKGWVDRYIYSSKWAQFKHVGQYRLLHFAVSCMAQIWTQYPKAGTEEDCMRNYLKNVRGESEPDHWFLRSQFWILGVRDRCTYEKYWSFWPMYLPRALLCLVYRNLYKIKIKWWSLLLGNNAGSLEDPCNWLENILRLAILIKF